MREIKFRALGDKYRIWHYGSFVSNSQIDFDSYIQEDSGNLAEIDYNTVGQFTGLHDKNGKEIYEGDIVLLEDQWTDHLMDDGSGPVDEGVHISTVKYIEQYASFGLEVDDGGDWYSNGCHSFSEIESTTGQTEFEIIGNIHEKVEL